jgi:hypothetical protein
MTPPQPHEVYERTMQMLKPALERVATDPEFRSRLEANPLAALAEMHVELDPDTRGELEGKRFSEFWAARQAAAQGPVAVRDLPPEEGVLTDEQLGAVSGGFATLEQRQLPRLRPALTPTFAPPYTPVGPPGPE